ncbi:MAG: pirin family protein [Acidimicrobiia bacterium]|nr:pirin family protein [Acidimicrobiia bacterium]
MPGESIVELVELGFPWDGVDPFIFTVHHVDHYPAGDDALGPAASLSGRQIGSDFSYKDGWSMYHGDVVPGFPQHPHRGFETVTVVRRGYVDHSDSLGATARYGEGDVQWLTTGTGIMHAEMFPLLDEAGPNTLELFQIWLNLPPESKLVPAYFGMLWGEEIPTLTPSSGVSVDVIAGSIAEASAPAPPPDSWASRPSSHLGIWLIRLAPGSSWELPTAPRSVNRMLHCFEGDNVEVDGVPISERIGARLLADHPTRLVNNGGPAELLLLQGEPIGAPVFQLGPFVMNTPEELRTALDDYRRTQFGGWPWTTASPVHARTEGRFALHADGRVEHRDMRPSRTN